MHEIVDLARWSATAEMFGARFDSIIDKLEEEIESRVADIAHGPPARDSLSFRAHAISSFAGNYGCVKLYAASRDLQTCAARWDDAELGTRISEVRAAAEQTVAFLRAARAGLTAPPL